MRPRVMLLRWRRLAATAAVPALLTARVPSAVAQTPATADTTYANPRVRAAVELAAAAHARPPEGLTSFVAPVESEIAILIHAADGTEVPTQVEQVGGQVSWRSDGPFTQRVSAYRAQFLGPTVSVLSFFKVPWVFAPLYGDRIPLIFAPDTLRPAGAERPDSAPERPGAGERRRGPNRLVSPFASDRADFYRFSGGDTVLSLSLPERTVPLVRVVVEALGAPDDAMVFEGEVDLDATRHRIDSSSVPGAWRRELGAATAERNLEDFADLSAGVPSAASGPRLRFGTGAISDAIRFDRVEGLFTGATLSLEPSRPGPGAFGRLHGGFAWAESTARGGAEVGVRGRGWEAALVAERRLDSTNDFPRALLRGPTVFGVFGGDDFDYVDRRAAGARVAWYSGRKVGVELGAGVARDRAPVVHVRDAPLGGAFRPLRPVREGSYRYVRATADVHGATGGEFLVPGASAQLTLDVASGSLDWQRVEASVRGRRVRGRWSLAAEILGGVVLSDSVPPQALLEVGGTLGRLPGFDYKAFSGDRAALASAQAMFALPWGEWPIRVGPLFLPAFAPSPAVELQAGWVGASRRTDVLLESLGWEDSDRVRATVFLGLRAVAGTLRVGFAHPLGERGPRRFELGLYQGI